MKKITMYVNDNFDSAIITRLIELSVEVRVETVAGTSGNKNKRYSSTVTSAEVIMQHYTRDGTFTLKEARTWVEEAGFQRSSGSSALSRLRDEGYVEKISEDQKRSRWKFLKEMII